MRIVVYCEPLLVLTSGNPGRGMLTELIALRNNDLFILVFRKGSENDPLKREIEDKLAGFANWQIHIEPVSRSVSNWKALLGFKDYCRLSVKGDVFVNMDCSSLANARPLLVTLADLSVFNGMGTSSFGTRIQTYLRRKIVSSGIIAAQRVICISEGTRQQAQHFFLPQKKKFEVVYNGVDSKWLERNELNTMPGGLKYWIWWGMVSQRKNLNRLLEAYAALINEIGISGLPQIHLVYSNDQLPEALLSKIGSLQLTDHIKLIPFLPLQELVRKVAESEGLLFPSLVEGFGMPVVEAMTLGKAVLTSDIPVLKEISNDLAVYCDPGDTGSLQSALKSMLDRKLNSEEIVRARKDWAAKFTCRAAAVGYSNYIDKLIYTHA